MRVRWCVNSRALLYACYKSGVRWLLVAATLVLTAGRVLAQSTSLHVTLSGDVAATDNALSAPTEPQKDLFFQLRPGLLFTYDAPRAMQELTVNAEILEYVRHSDAPSLTERASWRGIFLTSPLSEIVGAANIGTGQLNAITTATSPDAAPVGLVPTGAIAEHDAGADEYGSRTLSQGWRISESLAAHYTGTTDTQSTRTHSGAFAGNAGAEYNWRDNSVGLEAGAEYLHLERYAPNLAPGPDGSRLTRQLNPHGTVSWRHDFTRYWSGSASAGLKYLHPLGHDKYNPGDVPQTGLYPLFGAQVAYSDIWGRVTLSGARTLAPNLFVAQNTETTGGLLQLALPLPWLDDSRRREPKLVALGTAGFEHTVLIETDLKNMTFNVAHLDVGLGYTPRPGFTYGVRYEFLYQTSSISSLAAITGYQRNTLFFTFSIRYPDRLAVVIPKRQNSARADRKDLAPIGEEIVVPDNPNEGDR